MLCYFDPPQDCNNIPTVWLFVLVRGCHSLGAKQTDTNNAGDDDRDIRHLARADYGDLEVKTFPAIPHMPYKSAWFNEVTRTIFTL